MISNATVLDKEIMQDICRTCKTWRVGTLAWVLYSGRRCYRMMNRRTQEHNVAANPNHLSLHPFLSVRAMTPSAPSADSGLAMVSATAGLAHDQAGRYLLGYHETIRGQRMHGFQKMSYRAAADLVHGDVNGC